jgi:hypothetical protein
MPDRARYAMYALALGVSISIWFLAIRAPLWLDETVSFFTIKGGFAQILSRQGWPGVPAYRFFFGSGPKHWVRARSPSECFPFSPCLGRPTCSIALPASSSTGTSPSLPPWSSVSIRSSFLRPLTFGHTPLRPWQSWRRSLSSFAYGITTQTGWPLCSAFSAACIVYFQFLFVVILPALALCLFSLLRPVTARPTGGGSVLRWVRSLGVLPVIPGCAIHVPHQRHPCFL